MDETDAGRTDLLGGVDPVRAYLGALGAAVAALVGGSLLFPTVVYHGFVWKYFWGPVYADAHGETCAVLENGGVTFRATRAACAQEPYGAVIGYNTYNEVGYAVTLLFALVGLVLLLRHYEIGEDAGLFWGLLPFMFLGGALRVVEDAADAAQATPGVDPALTYPFNAFLISPVIYFTMFFFTLAALGVALRADGEGVVDRYERALAWIGAGALALTLAYLLVLAFTTEYVHFHPQFTVITVVGASLVAAATWWSIETFRPDLNAGTGTMGLMIVWGHAVDGVANVVGLDWGRELGLPADMIGKHPVNRFIVEITRDVLPESVTTLTGVAWPFLLVKVVVAVFVVAIFDETAFEESPRYAILMLIAILAVGLGPGTRDMLRATFGI